MVLEGEDTQKTHLLCREVSGSWETYDMKVYDSDLNTLIHYESKNIWEWEMHRK
jgi:hypothetical protein